MNWNIFYAVAIGLFTAIGAGLAGHLASTKPWHKWVFWGGGLVTLTLIFLQARSTEEQAQKNADAQRMMQSQLNELSTKVDQSQRASVGLFDISLWPNQELVPNKDISAQIRYLVREGLARNYRVFDEIFALDGKRNDELDRRAIEKFTHDSVGKLDYRGEDRVKGTGSQKTLQIKFTKNEIPRVMDGTLTVYAMGRVEWNNAAGADFHIDVCSYMESPHSKSLNNLGWHICHR